MKKRFLIVAPHPDDAELGIGGTMIKLKAQGHKVFMVDLTCGEPTPFGTEKKRAKEASRASRILKVDRRVTLRLENRYLTDTKEARLKLAEQIRLFKPDVLLSPYHQDAHPDHLAASKIIEAARFYAKYTKTSLKGKPHYTYYLFYYFCAHLRAMPKISFLVDVTLEFKRKMKAIGCYRSQFIDNPKGRFVPDYVEAQNRYLGRLIHAQYAEAIYCKEAIRVDDLGSLL
jgi:bacillithiol biosynthesis deacetylase BshB1